MVANMDLRFDLIDPVMVEVYRAMTPAQRVQAGLAATELVRERLRAHFREIHPEWSQEQVEAAVVDRLLNERG